MYDTAICGHIYTSMRTICGHIYSSMRAVSHWQTEGRRARPTIYVLILLHMCPHTTILVSSYYYMCALVLLHIAVRLHATLYVTLPSACILHYICPHNAKMCPHIAARCITLAERGAPLSYLRGAPLAYLAERGAPLSSHYMCPHTNICDLILLHVSSYYSKCVHILQHAVSHWQRGGRRKRARVRDT